MKLGRLLSLMALALAPRAPKTLVPCPFCGGPPCPVAVNGVGGGAVQDAAIASPDGHYVNAHVFCHECGAEGESHYGFAYSQADVDLLIELAVESWNKRDTRHAGLYEASAVNGLTMWPREPS